MKDLLEIGLAIEEGLIYCNTFRVRFGTPGNA
jgi:hypothetical protein